MVHTTECCLYSAEKSVGPATKVKNEEARLVARQVNLIKINIQTFYHVLEDAIQSNWGGDGLCIFDFVHIPRK